MTIPKSKILSSTRSILTKANVASDIQKNQQIQNVNVVVSRSISENPTEKPADAPITAPTNPPTYPYQDLPAASPFGIQPVTYQDRSAEDILHSYEEQLNSTQAINQALSLVIDILESNPLIINKFIIASFSNLQKLILLLTSADEIEIQLGDPDLDCLCSPITTYQTVQAIYVHKNNTQYNFHYAFPEAVRMLDRHKISTHIIQLIAEPTSEIIYN
jgi:hypothetical protein